MKQNMRTKRGDVAFVLLVVIAIAAVLSAGVVMVMTNRDFATQAETFFRVSEDAARMERYASAASQMLGARVIREQGENMTLAEQFIARAAEQESLLEQSKGFYELVSTPGAVAFIPTPGGYRLEINAIPLTAVHAGSKVQRRITLWIEFDGQGEVHKVYKEYLA